MKTCFLIAPIGSANSAARKRSDKLEKYVLKPALSSFNYSLVRADRLNSSGIITSQIIRELLSADLVIADITDHNPNVFYEMGIRHAAKRPIIHVRQKDVSIPFDTASMRIFDYSFDVDEQSQCIEKLIDALATLELWSETPFSVATSSYLVFRTPTNKAQLRSLDVVQTIEDVHALIESFLDFAAPGAFYWGQTVQGVTVTQDFGANVQRAIEKGATFKFIINDNPPYSTRLASELEACTPRTAVDYRVARDATIRFFAFGMSHVMLGARIDGVSNAFVIRDPDFIRFLHRWFSERFNSLVPNGSMPISK